ncbi:MAG TPA: DUF59 domain-containing protein [Candidatus Marinimicrobia bacterium]|nr:DUF59 domain-containing protein [Candidatus Neomarinimicrobiota bacterium]
MKAPNIEEINAILYTCMDPEIPVNIMDLGLVYDVDIVEQHVVITMTLTARGCPMSQRIANDVKHKIEMIEGVESAEVKIVWDPQWTPSMISPAGRKKLGME